MDKEISIQNWLKSSYLGNVNEIYINNLKADFLNKPDLIDNSWYKILNKLNNNKLLIQDSTKYAAPILGVDTKKQKNLLKLKDMINFFRNYGHLEAKIDPLNLNKKKVPELDISFYNFNDNDLLESVDRSLLNDREEKLTIINFYQKLKKTYCSSIGFEYMHVESRIQRDWITKKIENTVDNYNINNKVEILKNIIDTEVLEKYLSVKFPGTKRFSIEGSDALIPLLKEIIYYATENNVKKIILGMPHRGRINILVNILGKKIEELFEDHNNIDYKNNTNFSGDVKYHKGCSVTLRVLKKNIDVSLMFNPSHLEIVNPVVMGFSRSCIDYSLHDTSLVLPITLHGDASVCGQGVVQETLNMSNTNGYNVGGSIRLIINNQIGFTTSLQDYCSTRYCSDIFKIIQAPIFHVNADDIEAVIFVSKLAFNFRKKFQQDVVIDLVSYRRHGHNEMDDPKVTQPIIYKKISKHPTLKEIYSKKLLNLKIVNKKYVESLVESSYSNVENILYSKEINKTFSDNTENSVSNENTSISLYRLKQLAIKISSIPEEINLHNKVMAIYKNRKDMATEKKMFDWGAAEILSYASILDLGISIRISGEDSSRGTFFHRHAVIYDQKNGSKYIPLLHLSKNQGKFYIFDSVLSEEATLAFEYGYSIEPSKKLVIWEAQFGDFSNVAQVIIDQFITSGKNKWNINCGLIMLLPHGHEGQGPEHSSARIERFLQLCAKNNIQVCIPSTPSQFYHLIRRQAFLAKSTPLMIMTPKSLLRHAESVSSLKEISNSTFNLIIDDEEDNIVPKNVKRIVLCSGKIFYDLIYERRKIQKYEVAIIRIEQLYPFPTEEIKILLLKYNNVKDFVWCQEEPKNQGAWTNNLKYFNKIFNKKFEVKYIGRDESAVTASGYTYIHLLQQKKIVMQALNIN